MSSFLYFAYGSNMLSPRLHSRCPGAVVETLASVSGYELTFSKLSNDNSGKGTLVPTDRPCSIFGVVFRIPDKEAKALCRAEGPGYERHDDFAITCLRTGERVTARTYLAARNDYTLKPYDWYLALVLAGISEHVLGEEYFARIQAVAYDVDEDTARKSRREALAAFRGASIDYYSALLHRVG